jgi:hypothetical protein
MIKMDLGPTKLEIMNPVTDLTIRFLEQLNRTLELLQQHRANGLIPDDDDVRFDVEDAVLETIAVMCTTILVARQDQIRPACEPEPTEELENEDLGE